MLSVLFENEIFFSLVNCGRIIFFIAEILSLSVVTWTQIQIIKVEVGWSKHSGHEVYCRAQINKYRFHMQILEQEFDFAIYYVYTSILFCV